MNFLWEKTAFDFTSESVSEGHPDKVCDYVADSILDSYLASDSDARVACEVLCKGNTAVLAGEISSAVELDHDAVVRQALRDIGYDDPSSPFSADRVRVISMLTAQSPEIANAVMRTDSGGEVGAGDQGMMFGYATDETPELMPLPVVLAHRLTRLLSEDRKSGRIDWLRPDAKAQVTVRYVNGRPSHVPTVVVSTQHREGISSTLLHDYIARRLLPLALGEWLRGRIELFANPSGSFVAGGPVADCGLTGRKIIADTYGGFARHGGGAFSGKDATKVDRTAAYFCRFAAKQLVAAGICHRAEVRVAYAIGQPEPVSADVELFGTGDLQEARAFLRDWDFRPEAMIEFLGLRTPIFRRTTNYGHFGKANLPWELTPVNAGRDGSSNVRP